MELATAPKLDGTYPARIELDASAFSHNLGILAKYAPNSEVMAIVKANGYGHGMVEAAQLALAGGVTWLGVAQVGEALDLSSRLTPQERAVAKIFAWIYGPHTPLTEAAAAGFHLSVATVENVAQVVAAARAAGTRVPIHLKVDTGMSRGGAVLEDFPDLVSAALAAAATGDVEIIGIWSHLSRADEVTPGGNESVARHLELFTAALAIAAGQGCHPPVRHLAASAGVLFHPETHFDMVRCGIAMYGMSPNPAHVTPAELGLRPVLALRSELTIVKLVAGGTPVSYGGTWVTPGPRWLGVVPLGYSDGIQRAYGSGLGAAATPAWVQVGQLRCPIVGRVCMDQFIIDLGPADGAGAGAYVGQPVTLIGPDGPAAEDWAAASGSINYEVITALGCRIPRVIVNGAEAGAGQPGPERTGGDGA